MSRSKARGLAALVTGAAAAAVLASGCFSERRAATEPDPSELCDVSLRPDLLTGTIVVVKDFAFQPTSVTVRAGETVTWVNCSKATDPAHTATADDGLWDSPEFVTGGTYSFTFTQAGTYPYHCEPHPFMTATVEVEP